MGLKVLVVVGACWLGECGYGGWVGGGDTQPLLLEEWVFIWYLVNYQDLHLEIDYVSLRKRDAGRKESFWDTFFFFFFILFMTLMTICKQQASLMK